MWFFLGGVGGPKLGERGDREAIGDCLLWSFLSLIGAAVLGPCGLGSTVRELSSARGLGVHGCSLKVTELHCTGNHMLHVCVQRFMSSIILIMLQYV